MKKILYIVLGALIVFALFSFGCSGNEGTGMVCLGSSALGGLMLGMLLLLPLGIPAVIVIGVAILIWEYRKKKKR